MSKKPKLLPTWSLHSDGDKGNEPMNQQIYHVRRCEGSEENKAGHDERQRKAVQ